MPKYTPIDPNDSALLEHVFKEAEKQTGRPLTFHERAAIMRHAVIETPSEKWILARDEMRISPKDWFRHQPLDARDRALINACNRFLNNHWLWYQTFWTVENDQECRSMIRQAGSDFIGFENGPPTTPKQNWHSMKRMYRCDAMILRDCYAGTDTMFSNPTYGSRVFDVLLMKMCEDYDRVLIIRNISQEYHIANICVLDPWVVVAVKDSGPYVPANGCYSL
ncbi:hypothetical protein M406DRAFT_72691 [Cryphonectria parasitica EP155]|uniref:Uncharacterized protein n=1 Tax=Cryphonectria parasitica (strain ATCC 38755 / EP155) TaxID=660469 RepID=A0A9P5CKX0_CRYP1|nr:uncharacterized protein M406DRAFT_72691 [Cryphonectria parasitica EP155]KAF3762709.1 hypothetical protein M406DRAFT_72691 [Cryphonectria parasitica EP155]